MLNGTQSETGQVLGTLNETSRGVKIKDFGIWIEPPSTEDDPICGSVGSPLRGGS